MNLFDPPDTSNGYISRQGVREDHSDPTRTINLAKWVVTAPYTDENEEISPPNKKIRTLTVNYDRNFGTTTSILRQTIFRHVKIIILKYFCLNYPRGKAIFQTGCLKVASVFFQNNGFGWGAVGGVAACPTTRPPSNNLIEPRQ